ncbi:MAG: tRNA preQ1(34) S-adenosylmethionine ribosyltransferase-isomerase QueA [Mariprofundaceae bacterium]|nr:tRNA preQ1(34) S-adenosylmethionine ribosyltransferase-isomerase QueA [Mariprofundaceae bacterium]
MQLVDFDFTLPESLIADHPLAERDASRLLRLDGDTLIDSSMRDIVQQVQAGDLWVINNTRVIPARLLGHKTSGGQVEILLLESLGEDRWMAWGKANKPLQVGTEVHIADGFNLQVVEKHGRELLVQLQSENATAAIAAHGHMPLPPYIRRPDEAADQERYQTVFARHDGAVAAPTAGLHFTPSLMEAMEQAGARFIEVTLHVGAGTFQPVQVDNILDHQMHEEAYSIEPEAAAAINQARQEGRRVVAVGTTSLRCLESAAVDGHVSAGNGRSRLFIYPGYQLQIIDALLTNFHLPRSTLLMLVSAFRGSDTIRRAYAHAIAQQYRFFSYGDAMFCERMR